MSSSSSSTWMAAASGAGAGAGAGGGPCAALEDCAFCATVFGPPRCDAYCANHTVVTKESMMDADELTWCSGFRAEPQYCFLRWTMDLQRKVVNVPHMRRCVGSPSAVVGLVCGVLLLLATVLAVALGLPGVAMHAWRRRPRRRRRSTQSSSQRSRTHHHHASSSSSSSRTAPPPHQHHASLYARQTST